MPKAKWGAGDQVLTNADIDGAERTEARKRYSGELPMGGTYRYVIQSLKQGESKGGNPKLTVTALLDGTWMPNHKQYDGCPVWDHIPVMESTKTRVANFLDAIGATGEDLLDKCVVDENGYVTKLGRIGDPNGLMVYITVKRKKTTPEYPNPGLEVDFNGYIAVDDDGDGAAPTADGEDPPF